jgi:hypothetical protein
LRILRGTTMRIASKLGMLLVVVSALAYAETWSGKLYDAKCLSQQDTQDLSACTPTDSTTTFVLQVSDQLYKFDSEGNKKAAEAFKTSQSGAERAEDPDEEPGMDHGSMDTGGQRGEAVTATVQGTLADDVITIETIEVK